MSGSILGAAVRRAEDPRFLLGEGRYLPNRAVDGALSMVPVRAGIAHGRLLGVDVSLASGMPGVVGVFTAADLDLPVAAPGARGVPPTFGRPPVAVDMVRFAGEIVAVVVADSERHATDAAAMVFPDIEPSPAAVDVMSALEPGAPVLHEAAGTNVALAAGSDADPDLFAGADVVVRTRIVNQRLAAVPLETNSALAVPTDEGMDLWVGSQNVFAHRNGISRAVGVDRDRIHAMVADMGGGFGAKFYVYPEQVLVAAVAMRLQAPVRWHESRRDNFAAMTHGRAQHLDVELGAHRDGRIVALRLRVVQDVGAYPLFGAFLPTWTGLMASGVYDIPRIEFGFRSVVTATTPVHAYRGAGRPEATHALERAVDLLAAEIGIDPVEVRRRNFVAPDRFPHTTVTGAVYDSGDYAGALDRALAVAGLDDLRTEQRRRREDGTRLQLGIGVASYVEVTAPDGYTEWSAVDIDDDGTVTVRVGTSGHGQGHETAFAQVASSLLNIDMGSIRVVQADTDVIPRGAGTGGSRSLQLAGSAVLRATEQVVAKARRLVAQRREAAVADVVVFDDGRVGVAGLPDSGMTWAEVAVLAADRDTLPDGETPGLGAELVFDQGHPTYPFGTHVAVVEVDVETGAVRLLRHIACDDCGTVVNPLLVAGQVHGGVAQGVGQALYEQVRHDEDGNLLTGNLASYLMPTAESLPSIERTSTVTPTPHNPLGAKGIGEAATIGSTPAVHNAVVDALSHLGVRHLDMPLTPWNVWEAIRAAGVP
jgi:carbon-monoxide dehydrogenase large subunit